MRRVAAAALILAALNAWAADPPFRPWRAPRSIAADPLPARFNAMTSVTPRRTTGQKLKGTVVGPSGPVAGARVMAVQSNPGVLLRAPFGADPTCPLLLPRLKSALETHQFETEVFGRAFTDSNGRFEVDTNGSPGIWVDAPGFGSKLVLVGNTAEVTQLQIGVGFGTYARGTVVDEARQPLAGAIVTALHPDGRYFDAVTSDAGAFTLGPFEEPPPFVFVRRNGYVMRTAPLGGDAPIVMADPHSVKLTLRNGRDERPVAGQQVLLGVQPCAVNFTADSNGAVEVKDLAPGDYPLWAGTHHMGAQRILTIGPDDGPRTLAPLTLIPRGQLELDVGPPQDGTALTATLDCGGDFASVAMRATGGPRSSRFAAAHLPSADCLVEVEGPSLAVPLTKHFRLETGTLTTGRVDLPFAKVIHVRIGVNDAKGRPVEDATVHYARPGEPDNYRIGTLELSEGLWEVWATADGKVSEKATLTLPLPRMSPAVTVVLQNAPRVSGTVVDAKGKKLAGVPVSVQCGAGDPVVTEVTRAGGDFGFAPEATGDCLLQVKRELGGLTAIHEQPLRLAVNAKTQVPVRLADVVETRGTVARADGTPITEPLPLKLTSDLSQATATSADGGFRVALTAGTWKLWSAGPAWKVVQGDVVAGSAAAIRLEPATAAPPASSPDAGLAPATPDAGRPPSGPEVIAGVRVLDDVGVPLGNARFEAWTPAKTFSCLHPDPRFADAWGRGFVELRPGQKVLVSAAGYVPGVGVGATDGGTADIRLGRGTLRLAGKVERAGKPVANAELCLEGPSGQTARTDADGGFAFEFLPAGPYALSARTLGRVGRVSAETKVDVRAGVAPVTLTLP